MNRPTARRGLGVVLLVGAVAAAYLSPPASAHQVHGSPDTVRDRSVSENSVEQDVAALAGLHLPAKRAAARLVERGEAILPALHAAMTAPGATDEQQIQIATVLGEIGDASSIGPLIALAEANPTNLGIRQEVLSMLAELPASPASRAFVTRVLDNRREDPLVRRKGLVFFGMHRDERALRYVVRHRADENLEMRGAALFLAARLGDVTARDPIVALLSLPAPPSLRYGLMLGLAELVPPSEFEALAPDYLHASWEYASALRCARFRVGGTEERLGLWRAMIESPSIFERNLAAGIVLQEQGPEELARLVEPGMPEPVRAAARHRLRQEGFRVIPEGDKVKIERRNKP